MDELQNHLIIGFNGNVGVKAGNVLSLTNKETSGESLPYYDLKALRKKLNGESFEEVYATKGVKCEQGDIVLSTKGTVGDAFIIPFRCYLISSISNIKLKYDIFLPDYLKFWLESKQQELKKTATGLIPGLNKTAFYNMIIPLRSKEDQQLIIRELQEAKASSVSNEIISIIDFYKKERERIFDLLERNKKL